MTTLREKAHQELDLIPEESVEQVFNFIVSFKNKESDIDYDAIEQVYGMFHQYADVDKMKLEEGAFKRAMVKKHEAN